MPGIVLLVIGVGSLQAMLDLGHDRGWFGSPLIVTLAVVAALSIVSLLIWEAGEAHPSSISACSAIARSRSVS